ncbi:MAG TPA: DnaB-like helicase C-terminal domain-containing protein [Patescibacteria group bacterium]|nr:DnaB-like helicase C-terminal domain-containing protein [Patescibacteria group bacterium]
MAKQEQDIIQTLKDKLEIYLSQMGIERNRNFFTCINPDHEDSTPSCSISGKHNKQIFHCFGCLAPSEEIRTQRGLIKIKDIKLSDVVLAVDGTWKNIVAITPTKDNNKPMISFVLGNIYRDESIFTVNHRMLIVKEMYKKVPYINYSTYDKRFKFISKLKNRKSCKKYKNKLNITECYANEVSVNDYFLFPVLQDYTKKDFIPFEIKEYSSGPNNTRINKLIINNDMMWVYGLYCAEGNSYRGGIVFNLCIDEMSYALKVKILIEKYYDKKCTITELKEKNSITVHCSSTDLQKGFESLFGVGCENKKCPVEFISLPRLQQSNFLKGVFDGDGSKDYELTITSKELVLQLEHIAINLKKPFSYSTQPFYTGKDGIFRLPTYTLRLRKYESLDCFYETINNKSYCFLHVVSIKRAKDESIVYDLTIDGNPSFTTKHYSVHNCGVAGNIFHAAHYLEGLPIHGPEFFTTTLTSLAKRFGIEYKPTELSETAKEKITLMNAYNDASQVIVNFAKKDWNTTPVPSHVNMIKVRNINENSIDDFGIGSIPSIEAYRDAMLKKGWSLDYLTSHGLYHEREISESIFVPGKIIITISDYLGRPIAFVARKHEWSKDCGCPKYVNSGTSAIYNKSATFFGMDLAKKYIKNQPLYIVEGYIDTITLHQTGFKNVVALGSAGFSKELLEFIAERNEWVSRKPDEKGKFIINHIVFCFDGDEAGTFCTRSAIDLIATTGSPLTVEVKQLPTVVGYHDPDEIVRKSGLEAFKSIEVMMAFKWDLKYHRERECSEPEETFIKRITAQIMNFDSPIDRRARARDLHDVLQAKGTIFSIEDIIKEVEVLRGEKNGKLQAELESVFDTMILKRKTTRGSDLIEVLSKGYADIKKKQREYSRRYGNVDEIFRSQALQVRQSFTKCKQLNGFKLHRFSKLQQLFDGFPDKECLFAVAGDANIGKSTWVREVSWDLAQSNPDAIVLYMSIDDSIKDVMMALVARESERSRACVYRYGKLASENGESDIVTQIDEAWEQVLSQKNYIVADASQGSSIMHLEDHLDYIHRTYPNSRPIIFLDNFHKLRYGEESSIREKFIDMVQSLKELTQIEDIPIVMTVELRKTESGKRATLNDIAETKQIEYDAKVVLMAHQEMHNNPETIIKWHRDNYDPAANLPYLEMQIAKNKQSDKKCWIGYRFEPDRSILTEVDYESEIQPKRFPARNTNN